VKRRIFFAKMVEEYRIKFKNIWYLVGNINSFLNIFGGISMLLATTE
jgi:hypothetical protein